MNIKSGFEFVSTVGSEISPDTRNEVLLALLRRAVSYIDELESTAAELRVRVQDSVDSIPTQVFRWALDTFRSDPEYWGVRRIDFIKKIRMHYDLGLFEAKLVSDAVFYANHVEY